MCVLSETKETTFKPVTHYHYLVICLIFVILSNLRYTDPFGIIIHISI